jgi:pyrroline-5-carboxylate reductase
MNILQAACPLVLVGAGKMGGAMLAGWLDVGLDPDGVIIVDPKPSDETTEFARRHGLRLETAPPAGVEAGVLVLAVKPQVADAVLPTLAPLVGPGTVTLSIIAGKPIAKLAAGLGGRGAVVRAMPNTPAQVRRGMTVAVGDADLPLAARDIVTRLLEAVGQVAWVADEALMDQVTAVSGSGPAYVFLMVEALAEAGRRAGLPAELALTLARATVEGAGELLHAAPGQAPGVLRQNVTSPGGTTAAALAVLMADDGLQPLMDKAVAAATQRSRDLGA